MSRVSHRCNIWVLVREHLPAPTGAFPCMTEGCMVTLLKHGAAQLLVVVGMLATQQHGLKATMTATTRSCTAKPQPADQAADRATAASLVQCANAAWYSPRSCCAGGDRTAAARPPDSGGSWFLPPQSAGRQRQTSTRCLVGHSIGDIGWRAGTSWVLDMAAAKCM